MADEPSLPRKTDTTRKPEIAYIDCANCSHPKAMIVATTWHELLCFCPLCEHVWDCDKRPKAPRQNEG